MRTLRTKTDSMIVICAVVGTRTALRVLTPIIGLCAHTYIVQVRTILGVYWFHSRLHCVHCAMGTPIRERMLLALYSYCILNTISLCESVVPVPVRMILLSRTYWSTCTTPGELFPCYHTVQRAQTSVRGSVLYDTPGHQYSEYVLITVVCRYAWYGYYYPVYAIDIAYRVVKSGWNGTTCCTWMTSTLVNILRIFIYMNIQFIMS